MKTTRAEKQRVEEETEEEERAEDPTWDPVSVPEVDEATRTRLREIRGRWSIAPPEKILVDPGTVVPAQLRRAAEETPDWMTPFLPELSAWTIAHLGGQRKRGGQGTGYVFAFEGLEFNGVRPAAQPWVKGFGGPLLAEVEARDLKPATPATYLGKLCRALIGAGPYRRYTRSPPDPHPDLPLDAGAVDDEGVPPEVDAEDIYERFARGGGS